MTYFNYMDEPTRGWEEPYFQGMDINTHWPVCFSITHSLDDCLDDMGKPIACFIY